MKENVKDGPRSSTPSLNRMVASMGWGSSSDKQNGKSSRPSSRLSLMSRASSEMSINVPMDDEDVDSNFGDDNMALDMPKPKGIHTIDFMTAVNTHTQMLENGLRELRHEMTSNPLRSTIDIGTEAVILSGLKNKCQTSISNINKLYSEAKFLGSYLERLEAKAYYDLETFDKSPRKTSWFRRFGLVASLIFIAGYAYKELYPVDFWIKVNPLLNYMHYLKPYLDQTIDYIVVNGRLKNQIPIVHRLVPE